MVDSRGAMQELIPLGRSSVANPEDFARPRKLQAGHNVVGGRRGGQIVRRRSSGNTMPVAAVGSRDLIPLQQGMHLTSEAPNACKNCRASHESPQHLALFQRSVARLQNQRTSKGPMKLVIIADGRCFTGLEVIAVSTWKAST